MYDFVYATCRYGQSLMYTLCMRLPFMDTLMYTLCLHYSPVKADCDAYFLYTMMVIKLECYLTRRRVYTLCIPH